MTEVLAALILGLGSGTVFTSLGTSLVITYRTSGVLNFGIGAVAMYTTYVYAHLRQTGDYLVPIPKLPKFADLGGPMAFVPAVLLALGTAALLGLVLYVAVFRWLESALPLSKVVASIGVMLFLQSLVGVRAGTASLQVAGIFPSGPITIFSVTMPRDRLYMAGAIVCVGIALWALFRFTPFGLRSRAVADSQKGAVVVGVSPTTVNSLNWMLASVVAGISGILIAPLVPLSPATYTLFVVPALAAALIGSLTRLGPAIAGGLAIGMLESLVGYLSTKSWYPAFLGAEARKVIPLVIISVILLTKRNAVPQRGALRPPRLPRAPRPQHLVVSTLVWSVAAVVALFMFGGSYRVALSTSMMMTLIALSMVVVTGFVGQISLAQLAIAGMSAFLLSTFTDGLGIPFPVAPLLSALGAGTIGVVVSLPAVRIRGLELAVITIAAALAIDGVYFQSTDLTGGFTGAETRPPALFGLDLGIHGAGYPRVQFGLMVLAFLVMAAVGVAWLRRSRLGGEMLAVRANERAAAATGIDVRRVKVTAFAIGSFLAALGGSLIAYQAGTVQPEQFDVTRGIGLFAIAYLAGITTVGGAVLCGLIAPLGVVAVALDRNLHIGPWFDVVSGALLVVAAINHPGGVFADLYHARDRLAERFRKRSSMAVGVLPLVAQAERGTVES